MIDRRLIGLGSDPDRLNALTLLNERSAGVGEIADELGIEPAAAGRLLDRMHDDDMIEVVGEALRRGVVEPRYRALVRVLWDDADWAELDLEEQRRMSAWIVEMISTDAREAVESGTLLARKDSHASRSIPMLDEQGWEELRRIYNDALAAVFAVEAASGERLAEKGESGFPVLSAMLCCEMPPRGPEPD